MAIHDIPKFSSQDKEYLREGIDLPLGEGFVSYSIGRSDPLLHNDLLELREKFVTDMMHWFEKPHNDWDRYDDNSATLHIGLRDETDSHLVTGLRLTPIQSVKESLSFSMLNPQMVEYAEMQTTEDGRNMIDTLNETGQRGNLRDLTRLVNVEPTDEASTKHVVGSMMETFGVAAGLTRKQTDPNQLDDIKWLFTTTELMWYSLNRMGVQLTTLTYGEVNEGDASKSYLCIVDQEKAIQFLYDRPDEYHFTLKHLDDGLRKANAL